jgi:hypothetical protein
MESIIYIGTRNFKRWKLLIFFSHIIYQPTPPPKSVHKINSLAAAEDENDEVGGRKIMERATRLQSNPFVLYTI